MSNIDPMLMRQIIMDHYDYPRNKELTDNEGYMSRHMASDSCIDDITVQTKFPMGKLMIFVLMVLPVRFLQLQLQLCLNY